jgi:alginate O-acetyltransferase complex protein AlgJ
LDIRDLAIEIWGIIEYRLFNNGRPGVLIGDNGWLFTDEEFQFYAHEADHISEKVDFVAAIHRQLEESQVSLLVTVIPAKARVYSEYLGRYTLPSYTQHRYEHFIEALRAQGVTVTDVLPALVASKQHEPVFLRTDTHWTPFGAKIVAQAIAESIDEHFPQLALAASQVETHFVSQEKYEGDLLSFIPLGNSRNLALPADELARYETTLSTSGGIGLFSDISIPVALVGTSYSANQLWLFEGFLKDALQADVLNMASEGEGPFVPMITFIESDEYTNNMPKLVIWEIPERFLPMAYEAVALQQGDP